MSNTTKANTAFADYLDGGQAVIGLKSDVTIDNFPKRAGAWTPTVLAGMLIQGALTRKGLQGVVPKSANKVVDAIPAGKFFVRKL